MGIQGLLPFLKAIHTPVNIADFPGATVAVDAYCWLHKGAFSCAEKLALGEKTDQYVYYCMKYVDYMLRKNLKPILVFDGGHLKSKADVEKTRRERREVHKKKAAQFLREGKRAEAKECLQRCVDITPQMALELMNVCRNRGVDCIVAPYEADAQLAYLNLRGIADIIVTEDSDLLLFGCDKIIFKMDVFGNGILIEKSRLNEVLSIKGGFYTFEKFRHMCILSGCDYLPSIPGIGLAKACKVMKTARQPDTRQMLRKLPTYLKSSLTVTDDYIEGFIRADNTFLYQLVFDPISRRLCPLNVYPPEVDVASLDYAGEYLPEETAYQMAIGNIDVHSLKCIAFFDPDTFVPKNGPKAKFRYQLSIWDRNYCIRSGSPCKEIQPTLDRKLSLHDKEQTITVRPSKRTPVKTVRSAKSDQLDGQTAQKLISLYADGENTHPGYADGENTHPGYADGENTHQGVMNVRKNLETTLASSRSQMVDKVTVSDAVTNTQRSSNVSVQNHQDSDSLDDSSGETSDSERPRKSQKRKRSVSPWKPSAANIGEDAFRSTSTSLVTKTTTETSSSALSPARNRNVFAVQCGTAKLPKFDLNTPAVHVRSRYFVSGSSSGPTTTTDRQTNPAKPRLRQTSQSTATRQKKPEVKGQRSINAMFANLGENARQEQKPTPAVSVASPVSSELPSAKDSFRILKQIKSEQDGSHDMTVSNTAHGNHDGSPMTAFEKFQSCFSSSDSKPAPWTHSPRPVFSWATGQRGLSLLSSGRGHPKMGCDRKQMKAETDNESPSSVDLGEDSFDDESSCAVPETESSGVLSRLMTHPGQDFKDIDFKQSSCGSKLSRVDQSPVGAEFSADVIELKSCSYRDFLKTYNERKQPGTSESGTAEVDNLAFDTQNSDMLTISDCLADSSPHTLNNSPTSDVSGHLSAGPGRTDSARDSLNDSGIKSGSSLDDDVIDLTDVDTDSQSSSTSNLSRSSTCNALRQSGCRVPGLSKHKGKSSLKKSNSSIPGQRSIKDLMSKFQYQR